LNENEIIELLVEYCRGEAIEIDTGYRIDFLRREENLSVFITNEEIQDIKTGILSLEVNDETALLDSYNYEVIVREESTSPVRRLREDEINICNEEDGIKYNLSLASRTYLIWLLNEIRTKLSLRDFRFRYPGGARLDRLFDENENVSVFDYIQSTSFKLLTLKINTEKKTNPLAFTKLTHSFLFHLGYNLDLAIVPQRLLEELTRSGRITRMRRSRIEELDPPRRIYNETLVQHYLLAVSTDNPVIEYLSYYHILEHFFESVFNDDLLDSIKTTITNPNFSYKRKKDIQSLVNSIKKSLQIKSETITFSELEALRLCLIEFVDISDLVDKLNEYDDSLLDFYRTNKVEFAGGLEVTLEGTDQDLIFKHLSKRVYTTRNALVHSKDSDTSNYTPFKDDRQLVKEVPLIRFVAEMAIIFSSKIQ